MTPIQCKMARVALDIGVRELAAMAKVAPGTVSRFEAGEPLRERTTDALRTTLTAAGVEFISDERGEGVVKLRQPARPAATEAEMQASADDVRTQAADAVDEVLSGSDATDQQKAERRGALTDEPAVIVRARGKGAPKP